VQAEWHKSSYSGGTNDCVEAREFAAGADVRDTQNREAGHLTFDRMEWAALVRSVSR
jgi:hypothetical protein